MAQPIEDKFGELAPVLELMYVVMTHMTRYLDVYAKDIDATKLEEFVTAKSAMEDAIKKFNSFFGVEDSAVAGADDTSDSYETDDDSMDDVPPMQQTTPVSAPSQYSAPATAPSTPATEPGEDVEDQESLRKAKQAVDELKALFAEMKQKENNEITARPEPQLPVVEPVTSSQVAPFASPTMSAPTQQQNPANPQHVTPPPAPPAPQVVLPTPETTQAQQNGNSDASEIDSILAELRKLQNKGGTQM